MMRAILLASATDATMIGSLCSPNPERGIQASSSNLMIKVALTISNVRSRDSLALISPQAAAFG